MASSFKITVIFALLLQFIQLSVSQATRPVFSASPVVQINYVTKNLCTPKPYLSFSVRQQKPDVSRITLELHKKCQAVLKYSLLNAKNLWSHEAFTKNTRTVIFAAGWSNRFLKIRVIETMARPYMCFDQMNFIGMDFDSYLDSINSTFTEDNHNEIASRLSEALQELVKVVPVQNIHLIGHSLGAHIVSTAARLFQQRLKLSIPHVTGLDPSAPCYKDFGMKISDAKFTDVIHTNPYELGKWQTLGDVDFYVGSLKPNQPGCESGSCSSHRAWQYYAETAYPGGGKSFKGSQCRNWQELVAGKCTGTVRRIMGSHTPTNSTPGMYLVPVNAQPPYGLQASPAVNKNCWQCKSYK